MAGKASAPQALAEPVEAGDYTRDIAAVLRQKWLHAVAMMKRHFGFHPVTLLPPGHAGLKPRRSRHYATCAAWVALIAGTASIAAPASGPLRVSAANSRYFADATGKIVYLTGAHTWNTLVDMGRADPPEKFDFNGYLDFLERHHHNFIRLWAWDSTTWDTRANRLLGKDFIHVAAPLPWRRTGPGNALDGKPKFDLTKFEANYFERLRTRVQAAGHRGIYVSVMLFEGWGLFHGNRGRAAPAGWAWKSHPFHPENNINGIDPSKGTDGITGDVHNLTHPTVTAFQEAYIRQVVDTVNDFDNVLYEVINEGGEKNWDWWVANTIRDHEKTRRKQHPVGITGHGAERVDSMLMSPADWISPGKNDRYGENPPAWDGRKVSLLDTDHIWGVGGNVGWVWKSFVRGHNPLFMDPYDGSILGKPGDPQWEPIRAAMGHARRLAGRLNLAATKPLDALASTGYCLADPGNEYVIYQPKPNEAFTVELKAGAFRAEWINPSSGAIAGEERVVAAGGAREFKAPFDRDAVLYLRAEKRASNR
ncbi:MAG: DUF6298 domain-containing protein [Opitutaceae bacterium]|nr:DUF6298 domain-containing protein [Opitutaceae bacterium]